MTKGVIFDADGTHLDSTHIWRQLGGRYLAGCGGGCGEYARVRITM